MPGSLTMSRPFAPRRSAWHAAVAAMALAVAASALNASPASASASRSASAPATAHPRRAHVGHDGTRRRLEAAAAGTDDFQFWVDYPGSPEYAKKQPKWYDPIETRAGSSFVNTHGYSVSVACGEHGAIHLYADPAFNKGFDDKIRAWNPGASDSTGLLDRCGWPNMTSDEAPAELQYHRQTEPLMEDFSGGLDPETIYVARVKGCCEEDKYATNKYAKNINVVKDAELGKNVLAMTAWNMDDPNLCPGPKCHKIVKSTGAISTAGLFGSGRYEVIAKVPASLGLVWAVWTFHYEEHLPSNCADFTCWCNEMPSQQVMVQDKCEFRYDGSGKPCKYATVCDDNTDGWAPTAPPPPPAMTPAECGALHAEADPQFLGNSTFGGWATTRNDEVDIEIPANCASTKNAVCDEPGSVNGSWTCTGQYNTLNMNNYIYSQNSGTGPAYANMCAKARDSAGKAVPFLGDGRYHNYTIIRHTSPVGDGPPSTMFYIDGVYLGTNNAFSPTRGSRLTVAHWGPLDKNALWNGRPNFWGGGKPGDGTSYNSTVYVSEVNITPFNEAGDLMYQDTQDKPDGCAPNYHKKYDSSPDICHAPWDRQAIPSP